MNLKNNLIEITLTRLKKYLHLTKAFANEIFRKRFAIYELAKRDFQAQYIGSYLGIFWTYIQPFLFIMLIWTVLTYGFKMQSVESKSQTLWLIFGMVPWLFFAEVFSSTSSVIQQFSFLIKKVDFSLGILPIVKILSALLSHFVFVFIAVIIGIFTGVFPTLMAFQILYYSLAASLLLLGIGWFTSSASLFIKDINNVVALLIQFGFWLTPIFWNIEMVPVKYQWIVKLNPVYYIVTGYRDSLLFNIPFWYKPGEFIYFWLFVLIVLIAGAIVFRRLRPHFAEVI
jgi:lipopolysaccharide transport system permease protein/teichoic acid transport system permease protein